VYGEDAFLNGTMAVAFIKGLQGDDPKYWQAAALLKHFLANSNEDHRKISSSNFDSVPFRMGFLEGGARAVMASYNGWNGITLAVNPSCAESFEINGVSRSSPAMAEPLGSSSIRAISFPTRKRPSSRASKPASISSLIDQALEFLKNLEETLNKRLLGATDMESWIRRTVAVAKTDDKQKHPRLPEAAFLNGQALQVLFDVLTTDVGLSREQAQEALLNEYHRATPDMSRQSPIRWVRHPFRKILGCTTFTGVGRIPRKVAG
jgi:hypothetical protein